MALMAEIIDTKLSSFQESISQPILVDAIVKEYESIIKNNVWVVVERIEGK